jgi:dTDP-4-dehydrorhamnose 3,5-epimerase
VIYVPNGFAHGHQTLADNAEILYQISEFYAPNSAGGYRYDDNAFGLAWPLPVTAISEREFQQASV